MTISISNNNPTLCNTVFHDYFSNTSRLLSLCNSIFDTHQNDPNIVEICTLQGNFFSDRKNEIACLLNNNLFIFVENHTSISPNITFRFIWYLSQILKNIANNKKSRDTKFFSLPSPHCCIFFYGDKNEPFVKELKLSDSFCNYDDTSMELVITAYNINPETNQPLFKKCSYSQDYGRLIAKIKEEINLGLDNHSAISKAIDFCLENNFMKDYLEKNSKEVFNMLNLQWNSDDALQARFDDGFEFVAKNLIKKGLSSDEICELNNLSHERIKELSLNDSKI